MKFSEYCCYDAVGLAALIRRGEVSAEEVFQAALARLDEVNPKLNVLAHDLRERAALWPSETQASRDAPFYGVPFLLKDLLVDWQGAPTESGSRMMKGHTAEQSSALTAAYERAGLRIFGKTTTPEWGLYPVTEPAANGITRNPWHSDYSAGGSSGGSAAAVASAVVPVAHGGDGGGSIRLPAHNCGVFGLKPSRGRSSFAPDWSEAWQGLVCEHVLSRSVRDSAHFLDIAAQTGADALYACPRPAQPFAECIKQDAGRLKIAVWRQPWLGGGNDEGTEAAFAHSLKLLQQAGHDIEEAAPDFAPPEVLNRAARVLVTGETAKLLYWYRERTGKPLHHSQVEPTTWALMMQGWQMSAGEMAWARDTMLAQGRAAAAFFRRYDVLATPVCPRTTPKNGELMPSETQQKWMGWLFGRLKLAPLLQRLPLLEKEAAQTLHYVGYTMPFNLAGCPAMSVPLFHHQGLPVGTQFAAAHGREDILLRLAAQLEQMQPWADKLPSV